MKFSDKFMSAVGGWQRGWREQKDRRIKLAEELTSAIEAEALMPEFRNVNVKCYRKRYLIPNNSQNGGDLGPLFLNEFIDEGIASWTTEQKFAQEFKDPLREGTFAAIFAHTPDPDEVLINIPSLWKNEDFIKSANDFADKGGKNADALLHFKYRQGEIVMNAPLKFDELENLCGRSSPFDVLCEVAGKDTEEDRDRFWKELVDADIFPEEPFLLSASGTRAVLERTRKQFMEQHGAKIEQVAESLNKKL